jgi:hypothetical protein
LPSSPNREAWHFSSPTPKLLHHRPPRRLGLAWRLATDPPPRAAHPLHCEPLIVTILIANDKDDGDLRLFFLLRPLLLPLIFINEPE